jgi:hypothetical protein
MTVDNSRFSYGRPQWDMDRAELAAASTEVGDQVASKQDLESLLPDYGACRIGGAASVGTNQWLPFVTQIGTMRGCHLNENTEYGGIVLDKVGMWNITTRVQVGTGLAIADIEIRLETFDPDGVMVDRQYSRQSNSLGNMNISVDAAVVVDTPGYEVRVYSLNQGTGGEIRHTGNDGGSKLSAQYVYNGTLKLGGS